YACDDVFALRVDEKLAVELVLSGGGVTRERDARSGIVAQVSEHHRDNIDRSAECLRNRMYATVIARLLERPRTPHCFDRAPQLFGGICRKWCAGLVTDYRLELFGEITQCVLTQLRVAFDSCGHALGSEQVLERAGRHAENYIGVHLDESAIRIVREACTAARSREYGNRPIVETEI